MKKDINLNSKMEAVMIADSNYPAYSAGRIIVRHISKGFKQLRLWIAEKHRNHFNRLISLRVYDQSRH